MGAILADCPQIMPIECPRCLETNPDTQLHCSCGYDLSLIVRRRLAHSVRLPRVCRRSGVSGLCLDGIFQSGSA